MARRSKPIDTVFWVLRSILSLKRYSVKALLALFAWIRRRFLIDRDEPCLPPPLQGLQLPPSQNVLCPSYVPRAEHATLDMTHGQCEDLDGPYATSAHSTSPATASFPGPAHPESPSSRYHGQLESLDTTNAVSPSPIRTSRPFSGQGHLFGESHTSRAISIDEAMADSNRVNCRVSPRAPNAASTSAIVLLPISTHDLNNITAEPVKPTSQKSTSPCPSRPISENSLNSQEPIKVSRAPTPNRPSIPPQAPPPATSSGELPSRSSSPEKGWDILPMSTATVQRWKRGVVV